jgi:hypothetical protein
MEQEVEEHAFILFQFELVALYYVPTQQVAWLTRMLCIQEIRVSFQLCTMATLIFFETA